MSLCPAAAPGPGRTALRSPRRPGALLRWALVILIGTLAGRAAPDPTIKVIPGFEAERVYRVPGEYGSWVAMTVDPKGRLITSDQFGKLYRVTLPADASDGVRVATLDVPIGGAQGLLWAFDSLFVVANRPATNGGSGVYRLRDRDGDDVLEEVRRLAVLDGFGEHGPHAIIPGPDARSLYLLAGNATDLPALKHSRVPTGSWREDMLLPHLGQTDGVWKTNRPGGWIARMDPDSGEMELMAVGLRNPYDMAFNRDGELFTFDADMEWDLGTPWYRPTRVNHVTSGSEFGWRTGSSKWPDYYADSQPAVFDVGESSPTGLAFGYDARFPRRYRDALFMGDWSYGKIYALHLAARGATWEATLEQFLSGSPLPVTDLVVRPQDGALYFLTGGRNTPSALYRVRYTGDPDRADPPDAAAAASSESAARALRDERRRLERFHGIRDPEAVAMAWGYLGHPDRAMRYAARVAIEHQPVREWGDRVFAEAPPRAQLTALLALVRCGSPAYRERILTTLGRLDWDSLSREERLDLVRVYALVCVRMGPLGTRDREAILTALDRRFPAGSYELNRELATLLVYLAAPGIVDRALEGMETAPSQEERLHYVLVLRTLDLNGWTARQRERFFDWCVTAATAGGGVTYPQYLQGIRSEAAERLTAANLEALRPILNRKPPPDPFTELQRREVVKEWTVADLLPAVSDGMSGRDFEQGRRLFSAAMCIKCHRFNRQGGMTGPDLTGVGRRFDDRTLIESILEPNRVVSDQYATVDVTTVDGETYTGRIGDQNDDEILLKADLLNPANIRRIRWGDIESVKPSSMSLMPGNLVDVFTREEILDLLAYLKSQGDPRADVFQPR